ncbi:acyl-CoA dehydrogenase family protein [Nocardia sp. NPDC051321]|uniref:acyl-CoA dehydrogenase family protein n=1 Tax=Nocardia sp. NPDC051321 TaxID=3364323 RepID=UPI003789ABA2
MRYTRGTSPFLDIAAKVVPVLAAHVDTVDAEARFPVEALDLLRTSGLLGLLVPQKYGGLGGTVLDLVDIADCFAAECTSVALIWAMHCQQVDAITQFAEPALATELLPKVASGELYLASVTTEHGKGGHLLTAQAPLQYEQGYAKLDRRAPVVTGGRYADGFLITMRAAEPATERAVQAVFAYRTELEVEVGGQWDTLGMRGTDSVSLHLTGLLPPGRSLAADRGWPQIAAQSMIPVGHLGWAATWLGAARRALSDFIDLLRSRNRPGSLDLSSPLIAERLARVRTSLELASAYLSRTAEEVAATRCAGRRLDGYPAQIHLNTLKVAVAELAFDAVDRLVQLAGLEGGYRRGSLERRFRDLRSASLNYADDRLLVATGMLTLADRQVSLS